MNNIKKYKLLLLILLILTNIILTYVIVITNKSSKNVVVESFDDEKVGRPFLNIYDNNGKKTKIIFITHPFSRDNCIEEYNKLKNKGYQFLGISSYCDFPAIISNPFDPLSDPNHKAWTYDYFELCKGWCHCFRNPQDYKIPIDYPQILLSESDFAKYNNHKPDSTVKKEYDFIYVCLKDNEKCDDGWQSYNRNWEQAQQFLDIMCNKYHLKGILIGRINCKVPDGCYKVTDFLEYKEFIKQYNKCRFLFMPNYLDASPRVLTESLCYNLPVLCNYNILGGWKYINDKTGQFFNQEPNDFEKSLNTFLNNFNSYKPREYYINEYNVEKQGLKLLNFIKKTCGEDALEKDVKYVIPGV